MPDSPLGDTQAGPSTLTPQPIQIIPLDRATPITVGGSTSLYSPSARSPASASPVPSDEPSSRPPPSKRQRMTAQERAESMAYRALRKPTPVKELEGDDEVVRARLKEMTPERVRELQATLARQEGLYAEAYAALAAELRRAQVEEAVIKNVKKLHEEEFARAEYHAVASRLQLGQPPTSSHH